MGSVIWSSALPQNITVNQNGVIDVVIVTMKVLDMDNNRMCCVYLSLYSLVFYFHLFFFYKLTEVCSDQR